uniref:Uncharacterized protein n=1 Tax=Timema genevievae TaxID=629358 RepID=A0A7R9JTP3_TIMGE|nr:unnamed protein product [Timema genevievae]
MGVGGRRRKICDYGNLRIAMQVATLFRETATLLGASMEAQDAPGPESHSLKYQRSAFSDGIVKQEPRDDGYETSGDLELRSQADNHKMMNHIHIAGNMGIKCEPLEDPYSFVDDDPTPVPQPRPPAVVLQNMPKKRGRKKKIPEGLESTLVCLQLIKDITTQVQAIISKGTSHNKGEEQNDAVEEIETSLDNWEDVGHGAGVPYEDCMPLD